MKKVIKNPEDVWCVECGCLMKRRTGRYGDFYGCTGYPRCTNTLRLSDVEPELYTHEDRLDNLDYQDGMGWDGHEDE